jgi:hypothetical protein
MRGAFLIGKRKERSFNFHFCMTFAYRFTCYFAPLNTVHAKLELEESVSELMTGHEVHDSVGLVLIIEAQVVKVLIRTFAYRSTCYLFTVSLH